LFKNEIGYYFLYILIMFVSIMIINWFFESYEEFFIDACCPKNPKRKKP